MTLRQLITLDISWDDVIRICAGMGWVTVCILFVISAVQANHEMIWYLGSCLVPVTCYCIAVKLQHRLKGKEQQDGNAEDAAERWKGQG